jgi:hypothetical protein
MFEQLPPSGTLDKLSDAVYKWRGIAQWPETEATVLGYEWSPDPEICGEGRYLVLFSYRAGGKCKPGSFVLVARKAKFLTREVTPSSFGSIPNDRRGTTTRTYSQTLNALR